MNGFVSMKKTFIIIMKHESSSIDPYDESSMNHQWIIIMMIIMIHHHDSSWVIVVDHHGSSWIIIIYHQSSFFGHGFLMNKSIMTPPKWMKHGRKMALLFGKFFLFSKWFSRDFFFFTPPKKHLTNRVFEKGTWTNVDYPRLPLTFSPVAMMKMATRWAPKSSRGEITTPWENPFIFGPWTWVLTPVQPIYLRPFISGPPHHFQDPLCDGPHFTPWKITMVWTPEFSGSTVAQVLNLCFTMKSLALPNSLLWDAMGPDLSNGKSPIFLNRRYIQMVDPNGWKNPMENTSKWLKRYIQ